MYTKIIIALLITISIIRLLGNFVLGQASGSFQIIGGALVVLLIPFGLLTMLLVKTTSLSRWHKSINDGTIKITARREVAQEFAKSYLAPYSDIWKNLILSNKFCRAELWANGTTITLVDKTNSSRFLKITDYKVTVNSDLWSEFCVQFHDDTTFDELLDICKDNGSEQTPNQNNTADIQEQSKKNLPKLDINNCSEFELTELPIINIVMAKKVVKKRDEIGGFKTVEDFFLFLKLKPHAEKQLRDRICVNEMKNMNKKIARNSERNVDL